MKLTKLLILLTLFTQVGLFGGFGVTTPIVAPPGGCCEAPNLLKISLSAIDQPLYLGNSGSHLDGCEHVNTSTNPP